MYPGFAYKSEKGAFAVPVSWDISNLADSRENDSIVRTNCYFNGGGYFTRPNLTAFTGEILGHYSEEGINQIAIVKNKIGKGIVVLSGVHFEYDPSLLDADNSYLKERNVIPALHNSLSNTCLGIRSILKHLHIFCK